MDVRNGLTLISAALLVGGLALDGVRRRRGIWTRQSWLNFALLILASLACLAISLGMATMVDRGIYEGMPAPHRRLYFWTMIGFLAVGVLGLMMPMLWFARGRPDRQLGPKAILRPFTLE